MSTLPDDGGSAFPVVPIPPNVPAGHYYSAPTPERGMALRDYFAAAVVSPTLVQAYGATPDIFAKRVYELADAMLAERAKPIPAKEAKV